MYRTLTLLRTPNLRARSQIYGDIKSFLRLHFLYAALDLGLVQSLMEAPSTKELLIKDLSIKRPDLFESVLDLGMALHELSLNADGSYKIAGRRSRALSSEKEDPLAAVIQAYVLIHSSVFRNVGDRVKRESPLGDYLANNGQLIARFSRITEPYLREFVKEIVRETKPRKMLDIGCGSGIYLKYGAETNQELVGFGIEMQEGVAREANANLSKWGIASRFKVLVGDVRHLLQRNSELAGPFDLITLYNNIYYFAVEERISLFHDLCSKLSPHGTLAIASLSRAKKNRQSVMAADFVVLKSTEGLAPLPEIRQLKEQLMRSGLANVKIRQLIPFEQYYGIIGRL